MSETKTALEFQTVQIVSKEMWDSYPEKVRELVRLDSIETASKHGEVLEDTYQQVNWITQDPAMTLEVDGERVPYGFGVVVSRMFVSPR